VTSGYTKHWLQTVSAHFALWASSRFAALRRTSSISFEFGQCLDYGRNPSSQRVGENAWSVDEDLFPADSSYTPNKTTLIRSALTFGADFQSYPLHCRRCGLFPDITAAQNKLKLLRPLSLHPLPPPPRLLRETTGGDVMPLSTACMHNSLPSSLQLLTGLKKGLTLRRLADSLVRFTFSEPGILIVLQEYVPAPTTLITLRNIRLWY